MSSGVPPAHAVPLVPTSQNGFTSSNYKRFGFAGVQLVCPVICPAVGTLALSWLVQKLASEGRLGVALVSGTAETCAKSPSASPVPIVSHCPSLATEQLHFHSHW